MAGSSSLAAGMAPPAALTQSMPGLVRIDPTPLFPISPYLHMQFMEPLGVTDGSVEACWDYDAGNWRSDFIEAVQDLAPGAIRWGGLLSRYYRWREAVGPVAGRRPMRNYAWGGWETNRVGTAEFVELCRRTNAAPILCVNFLSDGHRYFARTREGNRTGDAREAADWVSYCNDPDDTARRRDGATAPYGVKLWQIGNETSYGDAGFTRSEAIAHTIAFAREMRGRDPSIRLIGWGDRGRSDDPAIWAADMLRQAGEYLDYIAIHMMQQIPQRQDTVLRGRAYQDDPARAWAELLEMSHGIEARLLELEEVVAAQGSQAGIAVTEGHLSLAPHNANPILEEWLTGAYHARALNTYQRHGARVRIATAADFNCTRWTVAAVRMQVPRGVSYLTPAGSVMRLFGRHNGEHAVAVTGGPSDLDMAASRRGNRIFLHVANLSYDVAAEARFAIDGCAITGGRVLEIAPERPRQVVTQDQPNVFAPREKPIGPGQAVTWRFPPTAVSVVELDFKQS
ncbi:alpha-L-arabinofuranosidase [Pseudoroseomonas wenyumeiae]|uniref:Alpha-L-arabinofuranosidase n=2 Tax=Teichococcus wenyumeiae TaxID=2478470 RepID=A0A3A9JA58_9PROT|nr:alpha-L-arabinofuranosidase [Pseudoroseomonas wenyumeiae]RKK04147.1 alpha-L-arabinofuranosidase [Pseudoroseomonas wenyumeiae]RMI19257.1 alpha-L-arabinofuranosidase [Pseudoroseomonas wenyumeiae]